MRSKKPNKSLLDAIKFIKRHHPACLPIKQCERCYELKEDDEIFHVSSVAGRESLCALCLKLYAMEMQNYKEPKQ